MNVSRIDSWRLDGCGERCWSRWHDPYAHQEYGWQLGHDTAVEVRTRLGFVVATGCLTVNSTTKRITVDGADVRLTKQEMILLFVIAERVGHTITTSDLGWGIWGQAYTRRPAKLRADAIRTLLGRLRAALGPAAALITTVFGIGLRLEICPPVEPTS